jgi:predicted RNA methylase
MLEWVLNQAPDRLIDPGCGSGRFAAAAIRRHRELRVVAIDLDPCATLLTRAALAVLGARATTVLQADYTALDLPPIGGRTAFVGNPPYVRHHDLSPAAKAWAVSAGRQLQQGVSALSGLHVHFYLATALSARPGDVGCFVTSSEWLDVNYGAAVRHLLLDGLGGQSIHLIDPRAVPFEDAMATATIACFIVGSTPPTIRLHSVAEPSELRDLNLGHPVERTLLERTQRWGSVVSRRPNEGPDSGDLARLGFIARVHRGLVTGSNEFFVLTRKRAGELGIAEWCRPAISSAEEILRSGGVIRDRPERRLLLDVPANVDRSAYPRLDAYLRRGEQPNGAEPAISQRYIPRHRRPWWYLGRITPPPIVASYMARQAPSFALNPNRLALLNIAHGIYPRENISPARLVAALNAIRDTFRGSGRTYHGGLEKFEPREMESLLVPMAGLDQER